MDIIETCGGNRRLIRSLNRLGVCASADTHARYVQFRIKNSLLEGIMSRYPQNAFTVVSVDNLDFIHSFARVYCGKQQLSWHGTTMQIVQPQPTALTDNCVLDRQTETHAEPTTNSDTCLCREQETISPAPATSEMRLSKRLYSTRSPLRQPCSPTKRSPAPKRCRRMRTGTERSCGSLFDNGVTSQLTQTEPTYTRLPSQEPSTIKDFTLSNNEIKMQQELRETSSHYILQRVANNTNSTTCAY